MSKIFLNNRFLSGLGAGIFGIIIISLGGWFFAISLGVIVHLALLEFFKMTEFAGIRPATKTTLLACQILLISTQLGIDGIISDDLSAAVLPISGAAICGWLLLQPITGSISDIASSIFGLFYLGYLPSYWLKLRNLSYQSLGGTESTFSFNYGSLNTGMSITFCVCLMIVAFDIGSYFFGRKYGRNTLSPISPSKTIEGAVCGLLSSIIIGAISINIFNLGMSKIMILILALLISFFALVGDLTESMMKRDAGIKDSGNALPGHGGILDRIDSYLFTPVIIYYILIIIFPLSIS